MFKVVFQMSIERTCNWAWHTMQDINLSKKCSNSFIRSMCRINNQNCSCNCTNKQNKRNNALLI